jgi:hypothetical protein
MPAVSNKLCKIARVKWPKMDSAKTRVFNHSSVPSRCRVASKSGRRAGPKGAECH